MEKREKKEKNMQKSNNKKKNKRNISKVLATYITQFLFIFILEISVKLLLKSFAMDWSIFRIFIISNIFVLVLTLITSNIKNLPRKIILLVFDFFAMIYAWLQLGFMNFLGAFMSMGNAEQGTKITSYIIDFILAYDLKVHLLFILFALMCTYFVFEKKLLGKGFKRKINFKDRITTASIAIYFAVLGLFFYMSVDADFMQNKYQTITNKQLLKYPSNPSLAIKNFGTTLYFLLDLKGTIFPVDQNTVYASSNGSKKEVPKTRDIDDTAWEELIKTEDNSTLNTLNNYFINRQVTEKNDYTGIFEGKNLIMIMMESISEAIFQDEYKDYFPTLYKLYHEGMTGVNNYSPKNNCATGESEMTSQNSLYSIETTCTVNTYKNNYYPEALMSMLYKNNYYTSAYHDYTEQYYYRKTIEINMGAQKYYGVTELGMKYSSAYKEWPSDLTFMQTAVPLFINEDKFASYMITVSTHTPFIYSSEMGDKHLDLLTDLDLDKPTKRYLSKVKELDLALENLLEQLEDAGKLDDTVLVLFGDHYPYALSKSQFSKLANYDLETNQEIDRTPFIIYNSETEAKKITKYTSPLDYTPTILNLFGIDYDPRYYMGHDVFSDYTDYVVFPDNSWQTSKGYYSSSKGNFIPSTDETLTDEEIVAINNEINDMRNMSALAIKKNYFKYLFEYFDEYAKKQTEKESVTETKEE